MSVERGSKSRSPAYVEKIRVPVCVSQPLLGPRDGWLQLFPHVGTPPRPETLLELLNSRRVVVPFIQADDSAVLLLTRVNIDWVIVGPRVDPHLVYPPDHVVTLEQRVDLRLIDESHVHALLQWNSPEGAVRLSDYLNQDSGFILARTGFGMLLVNRLRVRETRLMESTARPAESDSRGSQAA